jgi:hypothetical protein
MTARIRISFTQLDCLRGGLTRPERHHDDVRGDRATL